MLLSFLLLNADEKKKKVSLLKFIIFFVYFVQENGTTLAIKVCRLVSEMTHEQRKRWAIEVEIMLKLNHDNVIRAVPLPEEFMALTFDIQPLAMEYCVGGDLRRVSVKMSEGFFGLMLIYFLVRYDWPRKKSIF